MDKALLSKLKIKEASSLLVLNSPAGYLDRLTTTHTKIVKGKTFHAVQLFVKNKSELVKLGALALNSLTPDGLLWICYPKKTGNIETDLSRDYGWDTITSTGLEVVSLVAIDDTWSALRFRPVKLTEKAATKTEKSTILKGERTLEIPADLQDAFALKKKAKEFFDNLSYTNRKEYVVWITSAKKEETRERRVNETIKKLLANKKNPSEK